MEQFNAGLPSLSTMTLIVTVLVAFLVAYGVSAILSRRGVNMRGQIIGGVTTFAVLALGVILFAPLQTSNITHKVESGLHLTSFPQDGVCMSEDDTRTTDNIVRVSGEKGKVSCAGGAYIFFPYQVGEK